MSIKSPSNLIEINLNNSVDDDKESDDRKLVHEKYLDFCLDEEKTSQRFKTP